MRAPQLALLFALLPAILLVSGCQGEKADINLYSGYAEAKYVYVSAPVSGWITDMKVMEGDVVDAGKSLFQIDDQAERIQLAQSQLKTDQAKATAQNLTTGARKAEIASLYAELDQAKAQLILASSELKRQQLLVKSGTASQSNFDQAEENYKVSLARVQTIKSNIEAKKLPARPDEIKAADLGTQIAEKETNLAEWTLHQHDVKSMRNGKVETLIHYKGEFVTAGTPVIALLPENGLVIRFFVPETRLSHFHLSEPVSVSWDGAKQPVTAHVNFISSQAEYTPPIVFNAQSRQNLVFMVEAHLPPHAGLRAGQPVDVHVP
jgi:HlyD family secretion protein